MNDIRKEILTPEDIAYAIDPSVLKLDTTLEDVEVMVEACKKYNFGSCFCWPAYYPQLTEMLKETNTKFGTSLAFPSGQEDTETKVMMAKHFNQYAPAEHDMVMNVGYLISGNYEACLEDLKAVRAATQGISLKVIIEAMLLTDEQIIKACEIVMASGADYVKTGTGFSSAPTTVHHVEIIKKTVGDNIKIKVAGGVRDLDTLLKMYRAGAVRFGIGCKSAINIIEEAYKRGPIKVADIEL